MTTCDVCGQEYETPAWPWCPHGKVTLTPQQELTEYYDHGLDAVISTRGQRRVLERELGAVARNRISPGDTSARRDRIEAEKKQRAYEQGVPGKRIYSR